MEMKWYLKKDNTIITNINPGTKTVIEHISGKYQRNKD